MAVLRIRGVQMRVADSKKDNFNKIIEHIQRGIVISLFFQR